jgi:hypothetical protein
MRTQGLASGYGEICLSYHLDKAEASHDRESDRADKESDSIFLI